MSQDSDGSNVLENREVDPLNGKLMPRKHYDSDWK